MKKTCLVISPHADDATIYCGGYIALKAQNGDDVIVVRVTNDDYDSTLPTKEQTIKENKKEAELAYKQLGVSKTIHMGYESDFLERVSHYELREKFVHLIRKHRPDETLCFDIDDAQEENPDHKVVSKAFADALWVSGFSLHYEQHKKEGLSPYIVPKQASYFRTPCNINMPVNIESVIDVKVKAICEHKQVMKNFIAQAKLRCNAMGINADVFNAPQEELIDLMIKQVASQSAQCYNMNYVELFCEKKFDIAELVKNI